MVFSSLYFIYIFFPFVCLIYYLLKLLFPQKIFIRNIFLFLSSLFFYAWGEPLYVFLMLISIICNYFFALKRNKALFIISIAFNLFFLLFFKYSAFLISTINQLFNSSLPLPDLSLPIGISFYTFQALSYVIDVYRKKIEPQKNILTLALYICLFPQLIAGPIVRYVEIEKELSNRKESFNTFIDGLKHFMLGLACKVLLANNLAIFADGVFEKYQECCPAILWTAAIAYALQIYFDFYGYSKMAIGLGKCFGFSFPDNFNYPYCAASVTDFWRRWHITLSVWFRDYVYIPLGGNRVSFPRHIFNILITWLFTGFWHGASWNFLLWGLYYGILLIIEKHFIFRLLQRLENKEKLHKLMRLLVRLFSLFLILLGWILFRFEDFSLLREVLYSMFAFSTDKGGFISYISEHADVCSKILFIIPALIFSMPVYNKIFLRNKSCKLESANSFSTAELIFAFILFLLSLCLLVASTYNPFIYFRF